MKSQIMPAKLRIKLANECEDLVKRSKLSKKNFHKYNFYLANSKQIDDTTFDRMMTLFESLMREMYENSSWGWNEEEKLGEWKHPRTRVLFVTIGEKCDLPTDEIIANQLPPEDEQLIGFLCLRYEIGADKSECALYVYELHIHNDFQRQGLGIELMRLAKVLATEFKMDKIMLTVFHSNAPALKFYHKLKFHTDKSSPAKNEADYAIFSYKLKV